MFIDVKEVPPEGQAVERNIPADKLGLETGIRLLGEAHVSGRLTPADEGAFCLLGSLDAPVETACVRCLEPYVLEVHESLDLLYMPHSANVGPKKVKDEELELSEKDLAVSFYRDDRIDLAQMIREQVYLALPMKPLCKDDCRGLCPECGTNLNLSSCSCVGDSIDPRLATLKTLLKP
jgi:uncharacterized protein